MDFRIMRVAENEVWVEGLGHGGEPLGLFGKKFPAPPRWGGGYCPP